MWIPHAVPTVHVLASLLLYVQIPLYRIGSMEELHFVTDWLILARSCATSRS